MTATRRLYASIAGLALLTLLGALGFAWIEGYGWIDALYMSVITLSTVGLGEISTLSPGGRLFTSGLIVFGAGASFYLLTGIAELLIAGTIRDLIQRRSMERSIQRLQGHIIVCGYGRFGRVLVEEIGTDQRPVVVIEKDPACEAELLRSGCLFVIGSALDDARLCEAGVEHAQDLVVCTASDSDNLFITLAAREHNAQLRIHARAESEAAIRRLRTAGAHQAISSYQIGAQRIAASILRPSVVDFLEIASPRSGREVDLEEVHVGDRSSLVDTLIGEIEETSLRIVALKRGTERIELVPSRETRIRGGDHLVVIGARPRLGELARRAANPAI